jgi:hypothetical protein
MTYLDIENLLQRYGRWVRSGDGRVGYPRCAAFAAAIPAVIPDDAVADMADSEGERVGRAMMALKSANHDAYKIIEARFIFNLNDAQIVRLLKLGHRKRVYEMRQMAYNFLFGWFAAHNQRPIES